MGKSLVLIFHKEEDGPLFEKIIIALKARYTLVTLEQLEQLLISKKEIKNICHISFDDGDHSFYRTVFPVLKKHKVPVSLFVSPDIISSNSNFWFQEMQGYDEKVLKNIVAQQLNIALDKLNEFPCQSIFKCLTVNKIKTIIGLYQQQTTCGRKASANISTEQLKEAVASGFVTVGAHTINHPVLKNESDADCKYEIRESLKKLETLLGHPIRYFAYPNGRPGIDFCEREMNCLREHDVSLAFSTELDHLSADTDRLSIPRMGFARMGLSPSNPLVAFRLNSGKRWFDVTSVGKPSVKDVREKISRILNF